MVFLDMQNTQYSIDLTSEANSHFSRLSQYCLAQHKKVSKGLQTGVAVCSIAYHTYKRDPMRAKSDFVRVFNNSAWYARQTERFPILNRIDSEKFILGLSVVGMALSSPQLYDALMSGNYIKQGMAMTAMAAFGLRMVPPVEKIFNHVAKRGWKTVMSSKLSDLPPIVWADEKFNRFGQAIDHFVYNNKYSSAFFKHSPTVLIGVNAFAKSVYSLVTQNWTGLATGLASLIGTSLMVAAEFAMKSKQEEPQPTIFDPIEEVADDLEEEALQDISYLPQTEENHILVLTREMSVTPHPQI